MRRIGPWRMLANASIPRLEVLSVPSGHSVLVEIEDMQPCDQLVLRFEMKSLKGEPITQEVYLTVHKVPESRR